MSIYSKAVTSVAAGATANTYDNIGTVTLRSDARRVVGVNVCAGNVTYTAAEENSGALRITSSDLGVGTQTYTCPPYIGGGPATNSTYTVNETEFVPFNWASRGKENIVIDYSSNLPDPTAGSSVVAAVVYDAGSKATNPDAMQWFPDYNPLLPKGSDKASLGSVTAISETALTALNVPAWASEIVGFKCFSLPNLFTAGEERVGFMRFRSTIPDFEPQEWPGRVAVNAPLGTAVGTGSFAFNIRPYGTSFATTGKNETVTPYWLYNVVVTTGDGVVGQVLYR
jgi:hypothetical protein